MNYYDLINKIKSTALQHSLVNESAEGDVYEWMNSKNHKYPCVFITVNDITVEDDLNNLTANLIYLDRLTDNKDNKLKIQSIGVTVLKQIVNKLNEDGISCDTGTYEPFTDEKADICAGVIATVDFSYEGEDLCEGDFMPNVLEVKKNGEYDVTGYDKADVNVLPICESLTVSQNGTYLPKDYGVDAFDKVEVDAVFGNVEQLQSDKTVYGEGLISTWSRRADLNSWDTSKVTGAMGCFSQCYRLVELRVDKWNTSNFTDINNLFSYCTVLPELNVDNWVTSKVTNVLYTFEKMTAIKFLNLSKWDMSAVNKGGNLMFANSKNLKSLIGDVQFENNLIDYDVICLKGFPVTLSLPWQSLLRYTSMLAVMKGLADITGAETPQTITFDSTAWNNVRNDDDTIPSAEIIAERQAYLSSIAAEKGWTLSH